MRRIAKFLLAVPFLVAAMMPFIGASPAAADDTKSNTMYTEHVNAAATDFYQCDWYISATHHTNNGLETLDYVSRLTPYDGGTPSEECRANVSVDVYYKDREGVQRHTRAYAYDQLSVEGTADNVDSSVAVVFVISFTDCYGGVQNCNHTYQLNPK